MINIANTNDIFDSKTIIGYTIVKKYKLIKSSMSHISDKNF